MRLPAMPVRSGRDATLNFDKIAKQTPVFVSALPFQPSDGQEVYFQNAAMAAMGVVWHLRYRAASPFVSKWEFIGGPEIGGEIFGDITTASEPAVALTGGPSYTVPLKGRYLVCCDIRVIAGAVAGYAVAQLYLDTVATSSAAVKTMVKEEDIIMAGIPTVADANAGQTLAIKVSCPNKTSNRFLNGAITFVPRFVGE